MPKHHWAFDIAQQWRDTGVVLDAFVIERQHLMIKRVAEPVKNTKEYETSVLSSATMVQVRNAVELKLGDGLRGKTRSIEQFHGVLVADRMEIHGFLVSAQDVIARGLEAAVVVACAADASCLFFVVALMTRLATVTDHAGEFRRTEQLAVWRADGVQHVLAWRSGSDGSVLVICR